MDCKSISTYRNLEIQALNRYKEQKEVKKLENYILREAFRREDFAVFKINNSQEKQHDSNILNSFKISYFV